MRMAVLDGGAFSSREELHAGLAESLQLPEWYGGNLDALADCLGDLCEETELRICRSGLLRERLGDYAPRLFGLLRGQAEENSRLSVIIEED